jgi:glycosyltransferase involved in cell wall biosynthesis
VKVLQVVPSLDPADGGPSVAVPVLARILVAVKVRVCIATTVDDHGEAETKDGVEYLFFRRTTRFYKTSWSLVRWLQRHIKEFDLVHVHALFSFPSIAAAFLARLHKVPYIVRPLGVLNSWGLKNRRRFLKGLSLRFIESPILRSAAAIHYTTESEREEAGAIAPWVKRLPSFVSPLPIEIPAVSSINPERFFQRFPDAKGRELVLFLSRLDPKKGIELLLRAFPSVKARFPQSLLVIAGGGDPDYEARLRAEARNLKIDDDVLWTGFLSGEDKPAAFAAATVFVLPSYSENFGIAAAEAFAAGTPCILTDGVGIANDAKQFDAAIVTSCDATTLGEEMIKLLADPARRQELAKNGRLFVSDYLSPAAVGKQLVETYQQALQRREKFSG